MSKNPYNTPWLNCLHPRPNADIRLLCFPWAGGGSNTYARWGGNISQNIEVIGVRLPGRETRLSEECQTDINILAEALSGEIYNNLKDKPFAFFGHSMGIMVAYETASALRRQYGIEPFHMFLSGSFAPHSTVRKKRFENTDEKGMHTKSDDELKEFLIKTGGTPQKILENDEFMKTIVLPSFRGDLALAYKYYRPNASKEPFPCAITFFDGDKDSDHLLHEFEEITSSSFTPVILPGGHFYLLKDANTSTMHKTIEQTLLK